MIYDKLDHIETYKGLSKDLYLGLEFLKSVSLDIENGVHEINPRVKAIVSEYETKMVNENGFEAHREYIDIQYLISGEEIVGYLPIECLNEIKAYNKECDAAFYVGVGLKHQELQLGNGFFAIFFPQDGHMPCLSIDEPINVKKVVVKVAI